MGENVKVIVRCRPMNQKEIKAKCENVVEISEYCISVLNPSAKTAPRKVFTFDTVYDTISNTETIYNDMCYPLVESTLEGYNATIFAYGQTGCGKTHTMQGDGSNIGVIQKCFDHIFESIAMASNIRFLALVSYLEIYNENIRDLLSGDEFSATVSHPLKEVPGIGVTVPSLTTQAVVNAKQCYHWLCFGNKNRATASTLMNENSSRSHTIFSVSLEQFQGSFTSSTPKSETGTTSEEILGGILRGKLNLVDLAGSERQQKTGAFGDRLKEATKINLSLSALGNVISSLVDGKTKHVPYRDSKLTRLLQDSLGGNTKTLMISCISPADTNYDETLSSLRYANRAKNISNKPHINEDPKDAKLRQYQSEILKLKRMLEESQGNKKLEIRPDSTDLIKKSSNVSSRLEMPQPSTSHNNTDLKETDNFAKQSDPVSELQLQARTRIDLIKQALIGGERADDLNLRERHRLRKMEAERHLSAIAHALSRVESQDREFLQVHYASIAQEINVKNDHIKVCRQKIKMLEREVFDLNSEFQLDREDYLDEIRHLGRNIKFYQQLLTRVQPFLWRSGKNLNPDNILENSTWNDDLKVWVIPDSDTIKLPPTQLSASHHNRQGRSKDSQRTLDCLQSVENGQGSDTDELDESDKVNILKNYFRPNRQKNRDRALRTKSSQVYKGDLPFNAKKISLKATRLTFPEGTTLADHKHLKIKDLLGKSSVSAWTSHPMTENALSSGSIEETHELNGNTYSQQNETSFL
ncbi:osmotic avoidance abnormal protein 3 isoform X1 [Drosophila willistoni]|uniref:osmotic avoidance abnormal protein 3 isoform X1 n=1 Tax=Drosophila willistoni TaxID=7260 RepID=UPI000C26D2DE|nr:osmotic avoidance abnormal protein 3 isoform X1 [Drosophila willistoni]